MSVVVKHRHSFWQKLARPFVYHFICEKRFHYTCEKCDIKPPYIVIGNHTTDYDAFFMLSSFKDTVYFVMSDHISSLKIGKVIKHLVSPIPITKSTHDVATVRSIMSVIKQGYPVGLFPEGNKSFAGDMSEMKPAIGKLLKKLKVPVVIYNIIGGYFSSPRWTKVKRKGKVHGFVRKIIQPDELEKLSADEIFEIVKENLRVNAYEQQEKEKVSYPGKNLAKNIETLLYLCPKCKSISTLKGEGNTFSCSQCDFSASIDEYGYIHNHSLNRLDLMDKWQKEQIANLDFDSFNANVPITSDEGFIVNQKVNQYKNKKLGVYRLDLYKNCFELVNKKKTITLPLDEINGYAIEGVNGIQLSMRDGRVYRLKNNGPVSGLKYVNLMCAIKKEHMHF